MFWILVLVGRLNIQSFQQHHHLFQFRIDAYLQASKQARCLKSQLEEPKENASVT